MTPKEGDESEHKSNKENFENTMNVDYSDTVLDNLRTEKKKSNLL